MADKIREKIASIRAEADAAVARAEEAETKNKTLEARIAELEENAERGEKVASANAAVNAEKEEEQQSMVNKLADALVRVERLEKEKERLEQERDEWEKKHEEAEEKWKKSQAELAEFEASVRDM